MVFVRLCASCARSLARLSASYPAPGTLLLRLALLFSLFESREHLPLQLRPAHPLSLDLLSKLARKRRRPTPTRYLSTSRLVQHPLSNKCFIFLDPFVFSSPLHTTNQTQYTNFSAGPHTPRISAGITFLINRPHTLAALLSQPSPIGPSLRTSIA